MKKLLILSLLLTIGSVAMARTQYDEYGRIIKSDALRYQDQQPQPQRAMAAAKINYEEMDKQYQDKRIYKDFRNTQNPNK